MLPAACSMKLQPCKRRLKAFPGTSCHQPAFVPCLLYAVQTPARPPFPRLTRPSNPSLFPYQHPLPAPLLPSCCCPAAPAFLSVFLYALLRRCSSLRLASRKLFQLWPGRGRSSQLQGWERGAGRMSQVGIYGGACTCMGWMHQRCKKMALEGGIKVHGGSWEQTRATIGGVRKVCLGVGFPGGVGCTPHGALWCRAQEPIDTLYRSKHSWPMGVGLR